MTKKKKVQVRIALQYMLAGAVAGISEHIAMYPLDTVKTRMQALAHPGQHLHGAPLRFALASIIKREGFLRLYRGMSAVVLTAGCAPSMPMPHSDENQCIALDNLCGSISSCIVQQQRKSGALLSCNWKIPQYENVDAPHEDP
jgi:hypothetical protein